MQCFYIRLYSRFFLGFLGEIFSPLYTKLGKKTHPIIILSNKTKKNQIFGSFINDIQNLKSKNIICCGTMQLRCHKIDSIFCFLELRIFSFKLRKHTFCHWEHDPITVIKMDQNTCIVQVLFAIPQHVWTYTINPIYH